MSKFLPFDKALAVARSLGLASAAEWRAWCKEGMRPPNMPARPDKVYKDGGWQGWVHWLGTGNTRNTTPFLPFGEALVVARSLSLPSRMEWKVRCKGGMCPPNVPHSPDTTYKGGGWQGWGHWLGTGNIQCSTRQFLPFGAALAVAQSLGLASKSEWNVWCKEGRRPPNVPSDPSRTYKDGGWQGWGHWLGTGNIQCSTRQFLPFGTALAVARSLNLASQKEWKAWSKEGMCPPNVPSNPHRTYKDGGWQGWGHWLGTDSQSSKTKHQQFLPFAKALAVAQSLNLANDFEWQQWCTEGMCPPNVPSNPHRTYKGGGWQGWGHWLGTGNQSNKAKREQFLPFDECLRVARSLRLVSSTEWKLWCRSGARPANVPACPEKVYVHDGWWGWGHFLCHANLDTAASVGMVPSSPPPASKRAAETCSGTSGNRRGKRRRR